MIPTRPDAYKLLHDGCLALADVEANGIRVDVPRLKATIRETEGKIEGLTDSLHQTDMWKRWSKRFGDKTNGNSPLQLGVMLEEMGCKVKKTKSGRVSTDAGTLAKIDDPFVVDLLKRKKLEKLRGTYLEGVLREVVDGYVHPVFNLHLVTTYRSSSDSPNLQNQPIRDPEIGKAIRTCFIPRDGHVLVEIDYSQLEVRIAACYHEDPTMLEYIKDPTKDMHRDMAAECYLLGTEEVSKPARFCTKNMYVFPQFYGDYWGRCAPNLWNAIKEMKLETVLGFSLRKHLRSKGITRLGKVDGSPEEGTFAHHIQQVEARFWGERFPVYDQWKRDWFEAYNEIGGFDLLTGFRIEGVLKRNDVINYPVQGAAFHCLLWSLIRLQKWLRRNRMKSKIVSQVHDSLVIDCCISELQDVLSEAKQIMTQDIRKVWLWIIVDLEVEAEVGENNWWEKKEVEIA